MESAQGNQFDRNFSLNMRAVRQFRGITLRELSEALEGARLSFNLLSRSEMGQRRVSLGEAVAISRALGVSVEVLADPGPVHLVVEVPMPKA